MIPFLKLSSQVSYSDNVKIPTMSPLILVSEFTTQTVLHFIFTSGGIFLF